MQTESFDVALNNENISIVQRRFCPTTHFMNMIYAHLGKKHVTAV